MDKDAKMEPPIHTEYLRSGGAMILILMVDGAKAVISFCILSAIPVNNTKTHVNNALHYISVKLKLHCISFRFSSIYLPGYMVVPPDKTVLAYKSLRMSTSHFMMEL